MGPNRTQIGRGHAQIFICRKEIVVFHLGLGDFGDLVPNKPVIASTPNKPVEASLTKGAPSSLIHLTNKPAEFFRIFFLQGSIVHHPKCNWLNKLKLSRCFSTLQAKGSKGTRSHKVEQVL